MTSPCCNAPLLFTSYNQELWKEVKVDHWTCSKCMKAIGEKKPEQINLFEERK